MVLFEWVPEYSVSVERFDSDHQRLFCLIGDLAEAMREGRGTDEVFRILQELADYTRIHFEAEEQAMREAGYRALVAHMAEHRALVSRLAEYCSSFDASSDVIATDVLLFLYGWLKDHVLVTDRKYSAALNRAGIH
jgi:hemerythrin-like metal-binding protein